ncbi:MAG: GNAT family N-acetyltransferase [Planctomycetota bacterium]
MAFPRAEQCEIRLATDGDSPGIVALVGRCFFDYERCWLDVDREETGLLSPSSAFTRFWVLAHGDRIYGSIACNDHEAEADHPRSVELKKCYVHPALRRQGVATRLVDLVEAHAQDFHAHTVELWSDTRFLQAHALYERLGYRRSGARRELGDISDTAEFHFVKTL